MTEIPRSNTEAEQRAFCLAVEAEWAAADQFELSGNALFTALEIALFGQGCDDFLQRNGRRANEGVELLAIGDQSIRRASPLPHRC